MLESFPALALLIGAVLVAVSRGPLRALVMLAVPVAGAWGASPRASAQPGASSPA